MTRHHAKRKPLHGNEKIAEAAKWAAQLYANRTTVLAEGRDRRVLYAHPAYRVAWSEVQGVHQLSLDQREQWQARFEVELRKLDLLSVLRGKITAVQWLLQCRANWLKNRAARKNELAQALRVL